MAGWTGNASYLALFDRAKFIIKEDACIKFCDGMKLLCLETDASRVGLEAGPLQTREGTSWSRNDAPDKSILRPTDFANKNMSAAEKKIQ